MQTVIHSSGRSRRGATLALTASFIGILIVVGIVCFYLILNLGGQREGAHATSAGTLNVGKKSVLLKVDGSAEENAIYGSVSESNQYSLRTINRVWGHALLTMMNAESMRATDTDSSSSNSNETKAFKAANSISEKLSKGLNEQSNLEGFFSETGIANSLRMFNADKTLVPVPSWNTACVNRGGESNIRLHSSQIPPKFKLTDLGEAPTVKMPDGGDYLRGYYPLALGQNGAKVYANFVPFEYKQQPHLISQGVVEANTLAAKPITECNFPVPNAFKCSAQAADQMKHAHVWNSAAIANTMSRVDLEIPNGFVRIKLEQDHWQWYPNYMPPLPPFKFQVNVPKKEATPAGSVWPDLLWMAMHPGMPPSFFTVLKADYGHQYYDDKGNRTLYRAVYAYGDHMKGTYADFNKVLFNRVNQIKPGTSFDDIMELLKNEDISGGGDTFIIGRDKNGALMVANTAPGADEVSKLNSYINLSAGADGKSFEQYKHIIKSKNNITAGTVQHLIWSPTPFGAPIPVIKLVKAGTIWRHRLTCTPGTGVNGALLDVSQRDTVYAFWGDVHITDPIPDGGLPVTAGPCGCS